MTEMIYSILPRPMQRLKETIFRKKKVLSASEAGKTGDSTVENYEQPTGESFAKQLKKELDENARVGSKIDDSV